MSRMAVPKLRFKDSDGREFPEWELCKLGGLFKERSQRANGDEELLSVTIEQGVLRQNDLARRIVSSEDKSNYKAVYKGDIAYNSMRMWQGAEGVSNYNGIVSPAYTIVVPKENVSSKFFAYMFKTEKALYSFKKYSQGLTSDTWNLKYPLFSKVPSNIPSLPEQQKIADFLTAYDTMIDTQTKRVEAMKTRKKGLLQKIFSQEIRFKDDHGQDFPEWKSKKLGESTYIERGGSPRPISKYITGDSNGINWIKIGDAPVEGNVITSVKEKIISEGVPKSRKVFKGDLILSNSMSYGRPYLLAVDGCIHDGWLLIRNDKNIFDIRFLMQELASQYVKAQYDRLSNQGVVSNLNKELVKSVFIKIPSLPEQRKIADFLTTVDTQIEVEEKRLETMKTIKKGLLQQMFI